MKHPLTRIKYFLNKQFIDLKKGGIKTLIKKITIFIKLAINIVNPFYYFAIILLFFSYLIRPFFLIRWDILHSEKIGHFAANTEIYCCKKDFLINVPKKKHIDLFCLGEKVCNKQLALMWKRELNILPRYILYPVIVINNIVSKLHKGSSIHQIHIKEDIYSIEDNEKLKRVSTHRDLHSLIPKTGPHLNFTRDEILKGEKYLKEFGLKENSKIVCLIVRDSAYEKSYLSNADLDLSYNDYRDQNISEYMPAAEELTKRGYWVFRMGKVASKAIKSSNPRIIDYANSRIKNDFLDIYLGYKCKFCIRTAGYGAVPQIFRKPILYIEGPMADLQGNEKQDLILLPHYYSKIKKRKLTISEIFREGVCDIRTTEGYKNLGIEVQHNTSEEIKDVVIEMVERLEGIWKENFEDLSLQKSFFEIFEKNLIFYNKRKLFGEIKVRQSSNFIKKNTFWLK